MVGMEGIDLLLMVRETIVGSKSRVLFCAATKLAPASRATPTVDWKSILMIEFEE